MSKIHTKQIFILLVALFAFFSLMGAAAAENETTQVSPILFLTFDTIPEGVVSSSEITLSVSSEINQSLLTTLKNIDRISVNNIAYLITITSNGFNTSNLTGAVIQLPVSQTWTVNHSNINVITITNQTISVFNTSLIGVNDEKQDIFQVNLTSIPETVLIVSITDTSIPKTPVPTLQKMTESPTPTATHVPSSPAPLFWIAGCLTIGVLFATRGKE